MHTFDWQCQEKRMIESTTSKPIILIVDDSRLMRVAARKILKDQFEILEAADGEIAWEMLEKESSISVVMSDLSMPNLDGLGLLKKIRESQETHLRNLPVIIVTGAEDDDGSKSTALGAGASDFITKPFDSVQLLARAQAQVKQQQTQQALHNSESSKAQLEKQSGVEPLTGLSNQQAFTNDIEENLSYAIRHRTELSLLLIRIDKYKILFLRQGKQAAEQILRRIAGLLSEGRRREDVVARVGLDTFGILLPSANPIGARRVAEQLHGMISQHHFDIGGETIPVTASIAASSPPIHGGITADTLLQDASEKLKAAQEAGGNCVQYDSPQPQAPLSSELTPDAAEPRTHEPVPAAPQAVEPSTVEPRTAETQVIEPETTASQPLEPRTTETQTVEPEAIESQPVAIEAETDLVAPAATAAAVPAVASIADVDKALQALSAGTTPDVSLDALVRTVLPLLEAWNRTHQNSHKELIDSLKAALRVAEEGERATLAPASTVGVHIRSW